MLALRLLGHSFSASAFPFSRRPHHYGLCTPFVTGFLINSGLCSRPCLNLCNYSETAVGQADAVDLTASKSNPLVLSCPVPLEFKFTWSRITSACTLNSLLMDMHERDFESNLQRSNGTSIDYVE
jgi:hypothetical protein